MSKESKLILVEGISGAGKGSIMPNIASLCSTHDYTPHTFREPTVEFLRDTIKEYQRRPDRIAEVLTLLFTADRTHLYETKVRPLLEAPGNVVIQDRGFVSTMVYQPMQGGSIERVLELNDFYPKPDLTLLLLCDPEIAVDRLRKRAEQTYEVFSPDETLERIAKLKEGYEHVARKYPWLNARIVNANDSRTSVYCQVRSHIETQLFGVERKPTIFLDKDGTLVDSSGYPEVIPTDKILWEHTERGLRKAQEAGYQLILISSQPWPARGMMARGEVVEVFESVTRQYAERGITITASYFCPHARAEKPEEGCECKKPATGLLCEAFTEYTVDVGRSVFIGDNGHDIGCGRNFGIPTYLVRTGRGTKFEGKVPATKVVDDVNAAIDEIVR